MPHNSIPVVNLPPGWGWFQDSIPAAARSGSAEYRSVETVISVAFWFMVLARICGGLNTGKNGAPYGRKTCSHAGRPMSFWWRWPTRQPGLSGRCSAGVKRSVLKHRRPHNDARNKLYCEGNHDLMAKQGDTRDRPNPRHCPSIKLVSLTGRRSSGFHQGPRLTHRNEKAGYMTASSTAASNQFSPCNTGGVHT